MLPRSIGGRSGCPCGRKRSHRPRLKTEHAALRVIGKTESPLVEGFNSFGPVRKQEEQRPLTEVVEARHRTVLTVLEPKRDLLVEILEDRVPGFDHLGIDVVGELALQRIKLLLNFLRGLALLVNRRNALLEVNAGFDGADDLVG